MKKSFFFPALLSSLCTIFLLSCETKNDNKEGKKQQMEAIDKTRDSSTEKENTLNVACDTSYWKYVYNPDRLQIMDKCKVVTGIIEESNPDDDGDQHMLLKLDNGQESLLTKRNEKKKQGDLVIEAVCANTVNKKKVGNTCDGYVNNILLPKVGDHVKVTGSYVIDSHNGWSEIHPITKMEVLK